MFGVDSRELELARGGGSCVKDGVDDDGESCCVLETFDNNARESAAGRKVLYDWVSNASVLVRFSIKSSAGELELARGGGSCVKDDVDDDGE
nr:hypothetical protein [Tanacetum cinerariifolium]